MLVVGAGLLDCNRHGSDRLEELAHLLILSLDTSGGHLLELTTQCTVDLVSEKKEIHKNVNSPKNLADNPKCFLI